MTEAIDKILYTSIIIYVTMMILIIITKPYFLYDNKNKKFKSFGINNDETIISIPVLSLMSCVLIYFIVIAGTVFVKVINK